MRPPLLTCLCGNDDSSSTRRNSLRRHHCERWCGGFNGFRYIQMLVPFSVDRNAPNNAWVNLLEELEPLGA